MQVHPDIAALRSDRLAQRRIRAAMNEALVSWRNGDRVEALSADLASFGEGRRLEDCPAISRLMSDHGEALTLVGDWLGPMLVALSEEPLGELPHLYRCSDGLSSVQLTKRGRAALNLVAYERRDEVSEPCSALFADRESIELVVAGGARGTFHRRGRSGGPIASSAQRWSAGDRITLSGSHEARQIVAVEGSLLLLQLTREPECPGPSEEYRLSDGALLQTVSGDKAASQRVMALAVLGALEHRPALEEMQAAALDPAEDVDVRWEAVRHVIALDTATGMRLLVRLRKSDHAPLSSAAGSLERQLLLEHPQLASEAV